MSDDVTRDEFEALKERVAELEEKLEEDETMSRQGLDHRDEAVLAEIREKGDLGPRGTLKAYQRVTDVVNEKTAKNRAKRLRQTPVFKDAVAQARREQ